MSFERVKIVNFEEGKASQLDLQVAGAIKDLELNSSDLVAELRPLQFIKSKEVETTNGRKAIVIDVPFPQIKQYHRVQSRLVRELEKKFSDKHVIFLAHRKILPKPGRKAKVGQARPRSRTLTSVHDGILEDLVFPAEIVGKRTRVKTDGSKLLKVLLDPKEKASTEYKLDTFSALYRKFTGKNVVFEYPVQSMEEEKRKH